MNTFHQKNNSMKPKIYNVQNNTDLADQLNGSSPLFKKAQSKQNWVIPPKDQFK